MYDYVNNYTFTFVETPNTPFVAIALDNPPTKALDGLIDLWLHGKASHTARYYRSNAKKFFAWVKKPIEQVTLADVQAYQTALSQSSLALSSQARAIAAIKSLFTFAHQKTGLLGVNPAGAVSTPKVKDALAERILPEWVVHTMIGLEPNERNKAILKLLYIAGLRVSELTQLAPALFTTTRSGWSSVGVRQR